MIGITERIKAILTEYADKYNSAAMERDKLKADNSAKYLPQVANVENEKVDEAFKESIAPIKEKAFKDVMDVLNVSRAYIRVRIQDIDTEALAEINALKDIDLSESEINALRVKYLGNYWGLKALWEKAESKTGEIAADSLHNAISFKPEPDKYFLIFDEIEQEIKKFFASFVGHIAMTSTDADAVHSYMLLNGNWFNEMADRLDFNPDFFTDFAPVYGLTKEEQSRIKEEKEMWERQEKEIVERLRAEDKAREKEEWERKHSGKFYNF